MRQEIKDYIEERELNFIFSLEGGFWYEDWRGNLISLKQIEKELEKSLT